MIRGTIFALGLLTLGLVWLGPLPSLAPSRFSAHMTMHMGVVAVAAPLMAVAMAGSRLDPARRLPWLFAAVPASILELIIVWAWHAPALHHLARGTLAGLLSEQGMFLGAGLLVWVSALGGERSARGTRAAAGVVALLLTSMHMTLLGALLALAPRPLYAHADSPASSAAALAEQHLGGAIMLLVGGVSYLAGGVGLSAVLLGRRASLARSESL